MKKEELKFENGRAIIKKGRKIIAKIIDRESFFKAQNVESLYSKQYPFSLEIAGGIRECESLDDAVEFLNKYM